MNYKTLLEYAKDSLTVIRELVIVGAILTLIYNPAILARWAKSINDESKNVGAKSSEFNVGILKLAFDNTAQQLTALEQASKANADVLGKLDQLGASNPQEAARTKELRQQAETVSTTLKASIESTKSALLAQEQAIQDAPGVAGGLGSYGIVASADKGDDPTGFEVKELRKRGVKDVAVYSRDGFLRTVAQFADKSTADERLSLIQSYRRSAYVVNLDRWCKNPRPAARAIAQAPVIACE